MPTQSGTWTNSTISLFVNGTSAGAVFLGLLAILSSILGREAGLARGPFIPAADAGVAFILLGISLWILARWPREPWKRTFAQSGALAVVLWAGTTLIHLITLTAGPSGPSLKHWLLQWAHPAASETTIIMSATSAGIFILLGLALLIAPVEEHAFPDVHKDLVFLRRLARFCLRPGRLSGAGNFLQRDGTGELPVAHGLRHRHTSRTDRQIARGDCRPGHR